MNSEPVLYRSLNRRQPDSLTSLRRSRSRVAITLILVFLAAVASVGCSKAPPPPAGKAAPQSQVTVTVNAGGPVVVRSAEAEFDILPSGYVQAFLLKDGKRLSLDEPQAGAPVSGDTLFSAGREVSDFALDFGRVNVSDARGRLGSPGKRVEITGRSPSAEGIEKQLTLEVYDDFPTIALTTAAYRNAGAGELKIDRIATQRHRLNASLADPKAAPHDLWSFQGSSLRLGQRGCLADLIQFLAAQPDGRTRRARAGRRHSGNRLLDRDSRGSHRPPGDSPSRSLSSGQGRERRPRRNLDARGAAGQPEAGRGVFDLHGVSSWFIPGTSTNP